MKQKLYIQFDNNYFDEEQQKEFAGGVKYAVSDKDLSFYYFQGSKISTAKERDISTPSGMYIVGEIQTQFYRD